MATHLVTQILKMRVELRLDPERIQFINGKVAISIMLI